MVFQSRFGKAEWLQPYCSMALEQLANEGVKILDIVCPGFAADCLETLEEISQTYTAEFIHAGGKSLNYIPALNASNAHISMLATLFYWSLYLIFSDVLLPSLQILIILRPKISLNVH
jgi:ferrochelatase